MSRNIVKFSINFDGINVIRQKKKFKSLARVTFRKKKKLKYR